MRVHLSCLCRRYAERKNVFILALQIFVTALVPISSAAQISSTDQAPEKQTPSKTDKQAADKGAKTDKKADDQADKQPPGKPIPQISPDARYDSQGEATFIFQHMDRFYSPYAGANSLRSRNDTELTDTYTLYLGARLVKNLEVYINPELAWGNSFSEGLGLSAGVNGDLIGQSNLRPYPYLARYFVRWRIPMKHLGPHAAARRRT